jgi:hypothetical protein
LLLTGNVGIGITDPAIKLQVDGKIGAEYGTSASASFVLAMVLKIPDFQVLYRILSV